jgi:uncharacterized protein (DUF302 family)
VSTQREELVRTTSPLSVGETVARLEALIAERGLTLFAVVDHDGAARGAGLERRPTRVVLFGSPRAGTPVMEAVPEAALDLPLKVLVWDDGGRTALACLAPRRPRRSPRDPPAGLAGSLGGIGALVDAATAP